ncbi:MAG: hypothetical protein ACWIPJ_10925 [Polaribacter sp.]
MKKILLVIFILIVSCNLAPGSYPFAKRYTINLSEEKLIKIIEFFKSEDSENIFLERLKLNDGRRTPNDHWYHIYFHDSQQKKIIKTWIREKSKNETIFALIGIKEYSDNSIGNWKFINKDFVGNQNKKEIKEFEDRILYQLGVNDFIKN